MNDHGNRNGPIKRLHNINPWVGADIDSEFYHELHPNILIHDNAGCGSPRFMCNIIIYQIGMLIYCIVDVIIHAKEQKKGTDAKLYNIHHKLTMKAFIIARDKEEKCLNFLNLPNLLLNVSIFASHVCSCLQSFSNIFRPLSDNINAKSMMMNDCYLPRKGDKNLHSIQVITGDSKKIRGWDLLIHDIFLTYFHHDICGLAMYIMVQLGVKIWAIADIIDAPFMLLCNLDSQHELQWYMDALDQLYLTFHSMSCT